MFSEDKRERMSGAPPAKPWQVSRERERGNAPPTSLEVSQVAQQAAASQAANLETSGAVGADLGIPRGDDGINATTSYGQGYGSAFGGTGMFGGGYGSSMYGGGYGSSMYGSSMYGSSMYDAGSPLSQSRSARARTDNSFQLFSSRGGSMYGSGYGGYGGGYGGYSGGMMSGMMSGYGGGGMYGNRYGGYGMMNGMQGMQGMNGMNGGPPAPPSGWQTLLRLLHAAMDIFGRITFLVDENVHALNFFISAVLMLVDRSGSLYAEMARFVLRMLGFKIPAHLRPQPPPQMNPHMMNNQQMMGGQQMMATPPMSGTSGAGVPSAGAAGEKLDSFWPTTSGGSKTPTVD